MFLDRLSAPDRDTFLSFRTPFDIQTYLDSLPYVGEDLNRTPLRVMQDRQCHCLDGGLLGALALSHLGFAPLILDLVPAPGVDDDHVLALFRLSSGWGAVAKSNFPGLRFREPIYRSLRELVMTYFEVFFNEHGQKTLRGYTRPLDLRRYDHCEWQTTQTGVDRVTAALYARRCIPVLDAQAVSALNPMDARAFEANMLGVNRDGLYKPH